MNVENFVVISKLALHERFAISKPSIVYLQWNVILTTSELVAHILHLNQSRQYKGIDLWGSNQFWRSACFALSVLFTNMLIVCGHLSAGSQRKWGKWVEPRIPTQSMDLMPKRNARGNETVDAEFVENFVRWPFHVKKYPNFFRMGEQEKHGFPFTLSHQNVQVVEPLHRLVNKFFTCLHVVQISKKLKYLKRYRWKNLQQTLKMC